MAKQLVFWIPITAAMALLGLGLWARLLMVTAITISLFGWELFQD